MKTLFILILILLGTNPTFGQNSPDTLLPITLSTITQVNQGNSYITFPTDVGNIEPLWFEANLIPNFYIRQSKNSRLFGVLTPQIILRMYQETSFPVRTPSYMPQITVYYRLTDVKKKRSILLFGRVAHHSNGQNGDFFFENGNINLTNGNFATNFLEPGCIATHLNKRLNAYQFFKTSIEIHPDGFIQDELSGNYSQYRWHNSFSIFKITEENAEKQEQKPAISLKGEAIWMFGEYNQLKTSAMDRCNLSITFYYHPKFMEDIGLFVQFYHGSDYYNIYFNHRLDMLRFGIMTEKLRF